MLSNGESQSIVASLASQIHPQASEGTCAAGARLLEGGSPWPSASRKSIFFSQLCSCAWEKGIYQELHQRRRLNKPGYQESFIKRNNNKKKELKNLCTSFGGMNVGTEWERERERVTSITTGVWILYFNFRSLRERVRKRKDMESFVIQGQFRSHFKSTATEDFRLTARVWGS